MKKLNPICGTTINRAIADAMMLAHDSGELVSFEFNGPTLFVTPTDTANAVHERWSLAMQQRAEESRLKREAYLASPEGQAETARQNAEREAFKRRRAEAFAAAPEQPTFRDLDEWTKCVAVNSDPYGSCTVRYASNWARLMEGAMANGAALQDCAKDLSHLADSEGITGFMYGCAVSILTQTWKHGEELRRWHNLDTQVGSEGERANESGGVLNPALLSVG